MPIARIELPEGYDPRVPAGHVARIDIPRNKAEDESYVTDAVNQYIDARFGPATQPKTVTAPGASKIQPVERNNPVPVIPPTGHPAVDFLAHAVHKGFENPVEPVPEGNIGGRAFGGLKDAIVNPAVAGQLGGRFIKRPGLGAAVGAIGPAVYKQATSPHPSIGGLAEDVVSSFESPITSTIEKLRAGDYAGAFGELTGLGIMASPKTEAAIKGGVKAGAESLSHMDVKRTGGLSGVGMGLGAALGATSGHGPWAGMATGGAIGAALPTIPPAIAAAYRGGKAGFQSAPWSPLGGESSPAPERPVYGPQPDQRPAYGPPAPSPIQGPENMPVYGPEYKPMHGPEPQPPVYGPPPPVFPPRQAGALPAPGAATPPQGWQGPLPAPFTAANEPAGLLEAGPRFFVDPSGYTSQQPQPRVFAGRNLIEPGIRPESQRPTISPDIEQFAQEQVAPALRQDQLANQGKEPSARKAVEGLKKAEEPKKAAPVVEMPRGRPPIAKHGDIGLHPVKGPKVQEMPAKPEPAKDFVEPAKEEPKITEENWVKFQPKEEPKVTRKPVQPPIKQESAAPEKQGPAPKETTKLTWQSVRDFAKTHQDGFTAAQLAEKSGSSLDEVHKTLREMSEEKELHSVGAYYKPGQPTEPKAPKTVKSAVKKEEVGAVEPVKTSGPPQQAPKPFRIQSPKEIEARGRRMELQDKEVLTDAETAELEKLNQTLEGFKPSSTDAVASVTKAKTSRYNEINSKDVITRKELEEHSTLASDLGKDPIENWLSQDEIGKFKDALGINFTDAARILLSRGYKLEPSKFGRGTYELKAGKKDLQAVINQVGPKKLENILQLLKSSPE